jgi:hypothetical protein
MFTCLIVVTAAKVTAMPVAKMNAAKTNLGPMFSPHSFESPPDKYLRNFAVVQGLLGQVNVCVIGDGGRNIVSHADRQVRTSRISATTITTAALSAGHG